MQTALLRFSLLCLALSVLSFQFLDTAAYHFSLTTGSELAAWKQVTFLGDSSWMMAFALILLIGGQGVFAFGAARGRNIRNIGAYYLGSVAVPGLASSLIKNSIGRARPYLFDTEGAYSFSPLAFESVRAALPSGHTTTAFAFAACTALLFPRFGWPAIMIAVLAGYSRMAVGAHYLSDVFAGAALGTAGAVLVWRWLNPRLPV